MRKYASQAEKSKLYKNLLLVEVRRGCLHIRSCQSQLKKSPYQQENDRVKTDPVPGLLQASDSHTQSLSQHLYILKKRPTQNIKQQTALSKKQLLQKKNASCIYFITNSYKTRCMIFAITCTA